VVVLSVAAIGLAGCGGGEGRAETGQTPPDHLSVEIRGGGFGAFRIPLDCAIADRDACAAVVSTIGAADRDAVCTPTTDNGARITVTGTIGGARVGAVLRRRTNCETRAYDQVAGVLGL
jgi:hypothetical protein